jgi:hypothetical protein
MSNADGTHHDTVSWMPRPAAKLASWLRVTNRRGSHDPRPRARSVETRRAESGMDARPFGTFGRSSAGRTVRLLVAVVPDFARTAE